MRTRGAAAFAGLVVTGLLLGGCGSPAAMSGEDARVFTRRALTDAGLPEVEVSPEARLDPCGRTGPLSWRTASRVTAGAGGTVELCVERRGNRAVFVKDIGPGDVGPLLSDDQFRRLQAFRASPAAERRRNEVLGGASGAAVLVVAVGLVTLRFRRRSAPEDQ